MNSIKVVNKTEQPGALVMATLLDVISPYLGTQSIDILRDYNYACKRLYSKIRSLKIGQYDRKIQEMKLSLENNQSNISENILKQYDLIYFKQIIFDKLSKHYDKNKDFLIDFLVPVQNRLEINEINKKQIITFYYKIFARKNDDEIFPYLWNFILKGNNFQNYIKNGTLRFLSEYITQNIYNIQKAELFINNYELALQRLKENSIFKSK